MTVRVLADTNVLIYARDRRAGEKWSRAQAWLAGLADRDLLLTNLQVLNEFTRWLLANERSVPIATLKAEVALMERYGRDALQGNDVELAWSIQERLGYQWFDCLLLASAANSGCTHFLSEDMSHGARYGSLTIINPFRVDPDAFLATN